ncbi:uncharacterized protein F4807DRAFT_463255 [Annulohypoxylon truncatum]|uniref:uncharacterized protein n=1 Tax=Annulohypoxylon truncatum TaxID=327061 RepID=UPI002007CA0C|nr:uncharacterized protein F4807DRAFT_463255 [Annulohypoxylon truncatum]KAI1206856.1 hypothetical protein F4807DRAFT_463255 [Annulohypoxylon truncatum]
MEYSQADHLSYASDMMASSEAPAANSMAQLEQRNAEMQKEIAELREALRAQQNEATELREMFAETTRDIQFARNHAAKLQHEIKSLEKPRRTSARKRELEGAHARVREVEAELQQARFENAQLQQMGRNLQNGSDYWKQLYEASQAESLERQEKVEQLQTENAALTMLAGQQQPVATPPAEPQVNVDLAFDMGGDQQVPGMQADQINEAMEELPAMGQMGSFGYQQAYVLADPGAWQGGYDFNYQA